MEFLSHIEKNPASSAPLMSSTSALDSAVSLFGFPQNSASMVNWLQLYHDNMAANHDTQTASDGTTGIMISSASACHAPSFVAPTHNSEATSVTTKALPSPSVSSNSSAHLGVSGATAKVGKKRSRASRRAPTTLLNTDTSNFRAMVQQFTGIPQPPLQTPLFGRSLPHLSLLPSTSIPQYYTHRPQHYPSFPFQTALHDASNGPLLIPTCPSQGHPLGGVGVVDDVGLNSAGSSSLFPNPIMSWSERRSGYLM